MSSAHTLQLHSYNHSPVFAVIPDLTQKGYSAGDGLVVLTRGWQNPKRAQSGLGHVHVSYRHRDAMTAAGATTVEQYIAALLSKPYRIYDLGYANRLLIYRSVKPFGGIIVEPASDRDLPEVRDNLLKLGCALTSTTIYLVVTAYDKKRPEGRELWIERR